MSPVLYDKLNLRPGSHAPGKPRRPGKRKNKFPDLKKSWKKEKQENILEKSWKFFKNAYEIKIEYFS